MIGYIRFLSVRMHVVKAVSKSPATASPEADGSAKANGHEEQTSGSLFEYLMCESDTPQTVTRARLGCCCTRIICNITADQYARATEHLRVYNAAGSMESEEQRT